MNIPATLLLTITSIFMTFGPLSFQPMPVEYLDEVGNADFAYNWSVYCVLMDGADVPAPVTMDINYIAEENELRADVSYKNSTYTHTFPSTDRFMEFTDYIGDNTDIMFDHSEFDQGSSMIEWRMYMMQKDIDEFFKLTVSPYDDEDNSFYVIQKWDSGEDTPSEVIGAIDLLRSLFLEDILASAPSD